MSWFWFSFFAAFAFALVNVLDKALLVRFPKSTDTAIKITGAFGGALFLIYVVFSLFTHQSVPFSWFAVVGGIFEIFYIYFYYKAIEKEMVAFAVPIFSLAPVFVSIVWFLFRGETLTLLQFVGVLVTVLGVALFVVAKEGRLGVRWSSPLGFMLLSVALFTIHSWYMDQSLLALSEVESAMVSRLGLFLGGLAIVYVTQSFDFGAFKNRVTYAFTFNEVVSAIAVFFYITALGRGEAGLVNSIMNFQPILLFGMSYFLFRISPHFLKEDFRFVRPVLAVFSLAVLVVGSLFVSW